jgi:hypothetical protein
MAAPMAERMARRASGSSSRSCASAVKRNLMKFLATAVIHTKEIVGRSRKTNSNTASRIRGACPEYGRRTVFCDTSCAFG